MTDIATILFLAFNIWMLVDVIKRKAPFYWLFIILFVPFGGVIYFFVIKLRDFKSVDPINGGSADQPSVRILKHRYEESPSLNNQLDLAQALAVARKHDEAIALFGQILERYPEHKEALFGMGKSELAKKNYVASIEPLKKLIDMHRGYNDYSAVPLLAQALWESGRKDDSLEVLRTLVQFSPKLNHQLILARCLVALNINEEAQKLSNEALAEYEQAPQPIQRNHRSDAIEMRKLKKQIS